MGARSGSGDGTSKAAQPGKMIAAKRGIYLVRGDDKLRNIELISWEQVLHCVEQAAEPVSPDREAARLRS